MKRDKALSWIIIGVSILIMGVSLLYLITGFMVPGLIPLGSAILMVPLLLFYRKRENGKMYAVLFLSAAVLNLIAGVMQLLNAI